MNRSVKIFLYGVAAGILFLTVAIILKPDIPEAKDIGGDGDVIEFMESETYNERRGV